MAAVRLFVSAILFVGGVLFSVYGVFAILYNGDSNDSTPYVSAWGHEINADVVGAVALAVGIAAIVSSIALKSRGRSTADPY
jgi:hypothetical protein